MAAPAVASTNTIVVQRENGAAGLAVESVPTEPLTSGQVRIAVAYSPVNPSDLNKADGVYGITDPFPRRPGSEGSGTIVEVAADVTDLHVGQKVIAPMVGSGWWSTYLTMPSSAVIALPDGIDLQQASMLFINPLTAVAMLEEFVQLRPGEVIIQNAGNSGVGRAVISIAKKRGLRTVSVVRSKEMVDELLALGGDFVVTDEKPLSGQIAELTGGAAIRLALNGVGGKSASDLVKCLAEGGRLVTYGAMAKEPVTISNGLHIFKDIHYDAFWLVRTMRKTDPAKIKEMFDEVIDMCLHQELVVPVSTAYPLAKVAEAIAHSGQSSRGGKVLMACGQ